MGLSPRVRLQMHLGTVCCPALLPTSPHSFLELRLGRQRWPGWAIHIAHSCPLAEWGGKVDCKALTGTSTAIDSAVLSIVLFAGDHVSKLHLQAWWTHLESCVLSKSTRLSHVLFKFGLGQAPVLSACLIPFNIHLKYTLVTPISGWCKTGFFQQGVMILVEAGTATP